MKSIYKYKLEIVDRQEIQTFKFCSVLSVDVQNDDIFIWLMVDKNESKQKISINIFGTGMEIHDNFYVGHEHNTFVGTVQLNGFVWHIFANGSFTTIF